MNEKPEIRARKRPERAFSREVGAKAARKLKAQRNATQPSGSAWA
jgi:hypothetical protein